MSALPDPATHAQTEAAFQAALWAPVTPEALGPESTVARRFAVYRNNVQTGLVGALRSRFPVVERLVGADFFAAMARVFAAKHPPASPVLLAWGGAFPDFLAHFPPAVPLKYLPDVARLEWMRGVAYHAADHSPADLAALAALNPDSLRLGLAPCVQLFATDQSAVTIWRLHQPGHAPHPVQPRAEWAMVARGQGLDALVHPLTRAEAATLRALMRGAPLGQAAADTDPTALLTALVQHGLITDIAGDPA